MYACIDAPKQHDYVGLVYHPLLLLEQLLMNAEVSTMSTLAQIAEPLPRAPCAGRLRREVAGVGVGLSGPGGVAS